MFILFMLSLSLLHIQVSHLKEYWKCQRPVKPVLLPKHGVRLFIGVLSASNHFAEHMTISKTRLQAAAIKSSDLVVRFIVELNPRKGINAVLRKEARTLVILSFCPLWTAMSLSCLKRWLSLSLGFRM